MLMSVYDDLIKFLQGNTNPVRGIKEKTYLKTEEESAVFRAQRSFDDDSLGYRRQ